MLEDFNDIIRIKSCPVPYNNQTTYQFNFSEFNIQPFCEDTFYKTAAKVIVIGDLSVGKSSLINRFCHHIFKTSYKPTIGVDIQSKRFQICNSLFDLQIWDTAGQERFRSLALSYYRGARAIVIVFDLLNQESLSNAERWLYEALSVQALDTPHLFLVGSKMDMLEKNARLEEIHNRAVETSMRLKAEYWAISSKTGRNVEELFKRIACLTFDRIMKENKVVREKEVQVAMPALKLQQSNRGRKKIGTC